MNMHAALSLHGHLSILHADAYDLTIDVCSASFCLFFFFHQCVGCLHLYSSAVLLGFKRHTEVKTIAKARA